VELIGALDLAVNEFARRLEFVSADQWALPTPCDEWVVHYLVAHVVGGNRFARAVLDGFGAEDAIAAVMSSSQLGDDPIVVWATTVARQDEAFRRAGALDARIDHPIGQISGRDLLGFRVFDITLHAWALARALGVDDTLRDALVDVVIAIIENGPAGMGFGIQARRTNATASHLDRLLAISGRSASRSAPRSTT